MKESASAASPMDSGGAPIVHENDHENPPIPAILDLAYLILLIGAETPDQIEDLRKGRIPVAKGRILAAFARAQAEPEGAGRAAEMHFKDIVAQTGLPASTVSESVDQLVRLGVLARRRLESDRRSVAVSLTESGRRSLRHGRVAEAWRKAVEGLPPEDVETFWRVAAHAAGRLEGLRRRAN